MMINPFTTNPVTNIQLMSNCFTLEFENNYGPGGSWGDILTLHNVNLDHFIIFDN